jgi:hypothetical protein
MDRSEVLDLQTLTPALLHQYALKNAALFEKGEYFGGWLDKGTGKIHLDVVSVVGDRDEAIKLGKQHNQIAIFGFKGVEEISTGGTGYTGAEVSKHGREGGNERWNTRTGEGFGPERSGEHRPFVLSSDWPDSLR